MYSSIVKHVILPLSDFFLGLAISKELRSLRSVQWYSREDLINLQRVKLKKILSHSGRNIPYYSEIFKNNGIDPNENPVDQLEKIPFLTKKMYL